MFKLLILSWALLANTFGAHTIAQRIEKPVISTTPVAQASSMLDIIHNLPKPEPIPVLANADQLAVAADAYMLYDSKSGTVLLQKNAEQQRPMASTIKLLTMHLALQTLQPHQIVTVSPNAASQPGSSAGLRANEQMTVDNLFYGMMMNSGNDAAVAIAETAAGSVTSFVKLMNDEARRLQLNQTIANDPDGYDQRGTLSSVYDISKLMSMAAKDNALTKYMQPKTLQITDVNGKNARTLDNSDRFIKNDYPGIIGGKTGTGTFGSYTDNGTIVVGAGHVITAAVNQNNRILIVTVAGTFSNTADASYNEAKKILDFASTNLKVGSK